MLAKQIWVVVKDGVEPINDWILNQWLKNDVKDFKQTMFALNIQWSLNGVCDSMLESLLLELVDTNNENGRHIYEWNRINQSNKQYSKLIRIVHNGMTQIACHFEGLKYLNTINIQYSEVSFAVNEWGQRKLPPLELIMDCRFGRSNHSNTQYQTNTSNHKGTIIEIPWFTSNYANLNGL